MHTIDINNETGYNTIKQTYYYFAKPFIEIYLAVAIVVMIYFKKTK